jgi:uncharacterized membrane protein
MQTPAAARIGAGGPDPDHEERPVSLFLILLYLHIIGAIIAFGPGFAAMVVGPMVAKEPQHANFFARTQLATAKKLVTPVALSMAVTGVLMIAVNGMTAYSGRLWLPVAVVIYIVAVVFAFAVQTPTGRKLVELTSTPPAPGSPPNPEIPKTAARARNGGILLSVLVLIIAFLMVAKPF